MRRSNAASTEIVRRSTVGVIMAALLSVPTAWAQTERGSIRGTVFDPSSAVVPDATVTATNVATGVLVAVQSTGAGVYNFPTLQPGTYRVEVIHPGFSNYVHDNVTVSAANVTSLNMTLALGGATETVEVTGGTPLLQAETSATGASLDSQAYVNLPLSAGGGRRSSSFMVLVPGHIGNASSFLSSVAGGQMSTKEIQLDGSSMVTQEITGDSRNVTFPPDAVEEMSVATSGYAAEYGNTGGGVERYVLRSGTNQFRGSAYEFLQNEALDARGFFNRVRPVHREHEFGGTLGGPVVRNRTFFFFSFNGYSLGGANRTNILSVPTQAFREGDLSAWPQPIYDPATTRPDPDNPGELTRHPFPGNIIPADRIDPTARRILELFPLPNREGTFQNYTAVVPPNSNERRTYTLKGDHNFGTTHRLTASYVHTDQTSETGGDGLPLPIGGENDTPFGFKFFRSTHDWTITPNMVNQFRVGYNWQRQAVFPPTRDEGWPERLGLTGMELVSGKFFPSIDIGSFTETGPSRFQHTDHSSRTYTVSNALSWTKGAHNFKFGGEVRRMDTSYKDRAQGASLSFSRNQTALPGSLSTTGLEFASFLLGQVDEGSLTINDSLPFVTTYQMGLYAQDDFKVTPRLTLNYGLRFDMYTPITDRNNLFGMVDITKPNPFAGNLPGMYVFAGQDGVGKAVPPADTNANNVGPRVGMAYRLDDITVVRGGYGISYFPTGAYGGGNNINFGARAGHWITSAAQSVDQLSPAYTFAEGFPASELVVPPNLDPALGVGTAQEVNYWAPTAARAGRSENWNVTVQRQLAANLSLEVGYVGSRGTNWPARRDINQLDPQHFSLGSTLLNSDIRHPAVAAAGFTPPYPEFAGTLAQALRPFPQFRNMAPGGRSSDNTGTSIYHALQVRLERRFSSGLYGNVAYTWSRWRTDAPNNFVNNAAVHQNFYDRDMNIISPEAHRPHVVAVAFVYELPFGRGKPLLGGGGVWGALFGGWQVNGLLQYMHGERLGVSGPQTNPTYDDIPQTADRVPGVPMQSWEGRFDPAADRWVNPEAFALPVGPFGNTPVVIDGLFGPAFLNEDLGLTKRTRIGKVDLEIRLEMFNVLNRTRFGNPSTNLGNLETFGSITSASGERTGQVAIKLAF